MRRFTRQKNGTVNLTPVIALDYVITQSLKFSSKKIEFGAKNVDVSHGCLLDIDVVDGYYKSRVCCRHVATLISLIGQVHVTWHRFSRAPIEIENFFLPGTIIRLPGTQN